MNKGPVLMHNAKEDSKYSHNKEPLTLLEERGVFNPPCNLGITVEDLNSLFFLKKPNGKFHLVTAFASVCRYLKNPQPPLNRIVDSILRHIANWRYITVLDLKNPSTKSHCQSHTFCRVVTQFRGVCVYIRPENKLPESETTH